ncbi:hypothetical protein NIES592_12395 [Fischerella major NIES-592]|uniref:Uncharacterized protein n=1 Tax=Fischerella major NIES-592 TaxID=210994 RepID=A0A1U7GZY5_9CYAN|nr:hypothetical protein NIES592_12395 [Fischerella major NIES-592]
MVEAGEPLLIPFPYKSDTFSDQTKGTRRTRRTRGKIYIKNFVKWYKTLPLTIVQPSNKLGDSSSLLQECLLPIPFLFVNKAYQLS